MNEEKNVNTEPKPKKKRSFWWLKLLLVLVLVAAGLIGGIMLSSQEITQQILGEFFPQYAVSRVETIVPAAVEKQPVETVSPTPRPSKAPVEIISPEAKEKETVEEVFDDAAVKDEAAVTDEVLSETLAPDTLPEFLPAADAAVNEAIGIDAALEIALEHAGADKEESFVYGISREKDDGLVYYEVEFSYNGIEYDYEINAYTGVVEGWETVREKKYGQANAQSENTAKSYISVENAMKTALEHAGFDQSDVSNLRTSIENERNMLVYDIEFRADGYDYEYKINACSGVIVSREKDRD